jgi:hypothetical protein
VALRNRDRDPRADARPLAGGDRRGLGRVQVEPGVAGVRTGGKAGVLVQARDAKLHAAHLVAVAAAVSVGGVRLVAVDRKLGEAMAERARDASLDKHALGPVVALEVARDAV